MESKTTSKVLKTAPPGVENIRPMTSDFNASPQTKAISVDLKANFIAMDHYETDPKKHFLSTAKSDYKRFNLLQERKLNSKVTCSWNHQKEVCDTLSKVSARAKSPTTRLANPFFDSACPRSPSPIRNRSPWHL